MEARPAGEGPGCPSCGSTFLLRDGRRWWERLVGVRSAWRCNRCGARCRRWSASPERDGRMETTGETRAAESRRAPRVKLLAKVQVRAESVESFRVAQSHNISLGGIFLAMEAPLPVGKEVLLTVVLPDRPLFDAKGRVVWRRAAADEQGPAGMGIVFTEISEESREVLRSLMAQEEPEPG